MERLRWFLIWGAVFYVGGGIALFLAWPSGSSSLYGESSGSLFWTFVGAAVASGGAGMLLVALIGWGVKFGREAVDPAVR